MKVKVGEKCETNKDCINNNCVNNICTRRPRIKNIKTQNVKSQNVKAQNVKAQNVKALSVKAQNVKAQNVKALSVKAQNVKALSVKAQNVKAQNVKAQSVKAQSVKVKNKKIKIGSKCQTNKDCINNNCVNNICTRRARRKNVKTQSVKTQNVKAQNVKAQNVKALSVKAQSVKAQNVKAQNVKAQNVKAQNVKALSVKAQNVKAQSVKAHNVKAQNVKAQSVKAQSVKVKNKKIKIGSKCQTNKDCINNNCVNNICTRRARRKNVKAQSVKAQNVKAQSVKAQSVKAQSVKAQSVKAQNVKAQSVKAQSVKAQNVKAQSVKAQSVKAQSVKAQSVKAQNVKVKNYTKKRDIAKKVSYKESKKNSANRSIFNPPLGIKTPNLIPKNVRKFYVIPETEEMMKIHDNLSEIGINKNSFFFDPCYFLNNLNKILKNPKFKKFKKKTFLLLPIVYPKDKNYRINNYNKQKMENKTEFNKQIKNALLGNKNLNLDMSLDNVVGKGSYGVIYKSTVDNKEIVIKIPNKNDYNDNLDENIIQNELFCALRGNWSTGARIPKIEYIARLYKPNSLVSKHVELKIITGMEKMEGNLIQFIYEVLPTLKIDDVDKILKEMFIQICELLIKLQDKYDFHHRDFHMGNIMYNNFGSKTNPKYKWYIIDFGFSYMNINGRKYHAKSINMYKKYKSPNKSFDLRLLFTNISELEKLTATHPDCKSINLISSICKQIYRHYIFDLKINLNNYVTPWHASYLTFDNKLETDKFTDPREFIKLIKKL